MHLEIGLLYVFSKGREQWRVYKGSFRIFSPHLDFIYHSLIFMCFRPNLTLMPKSNMDFSFRAHLTTLRTMLVLSVGVKARTPKKKKKMFFVY